MRQPASGGAYKDAGVDIEAGDALVRAIGPAIARTDRPGVMGAIGGFGGLFDLKAAGFTDPVLVAATDGVGTKLKLALDCGELGGVGIDLVAMCVNDLVCQGASPLFFLDYFATSKLDVPSAQAVIEGIAKGCETAGCALIGGETAEMPGLYAPGDFDLAGFAVGAAERGTLLPRQDIEAGDLLIALPSSGLHSNGFSLVRKIVTQSGCDLADAAPFDNGRSLGAALLEPTRIYVAEALALHKTGRIKALAHITGGGLTENIPRILPKGLGANMDAQSWEAPPLFGWLARTAGLDAADMVQTFNCGVGMVAVIPAGDVDAVLADLKALGLEGSVAGRVVGDESHGVRVANTDWLTD